MRSIWRSIPVFLASALLGGCVDAVESSARQAPAEAALRARFPGRASEVLGAGRRLLQTGDGFELSPMSTGLSAGEVGLALPRSGAEAIRLEAPGGFEIRVREIGAFGEITPAEGAAAYPREGGISFWAASGRSPAASPVDPSPQAASTDVEEWLLLEAAAVRGGLPAARWEIEGALLKQHPGLIEVVDEDGNARLRVTAPAAWTESGRAVEAELRVEQGTIALYVDGGGEAVLVDPQWSSTASLALPRSGHAAVVLSDGRALAIGGFGANDTVEIFDPATRTWSMRAPMSTSRRDLAAAALLPDGRVLVAGGFDGSSYTDSAEVYDPAVDAWSPAGALYLRRGHSGCAVLQDGRVLVAGGEREFGGDLTAVDIYDPVSGVWQRAAPMPESHSDATATVLLSGDVLVVGGSSGSLAHVYHPPTDSWTATPYMASLRSDHSAVRLPDGRVLVAGGVRSGFVRTAEIYDPATNTWSTTGSTLADHDDGAAVQLAGGEPMIISGSDFGDATTAEIFDPATGTWAAAASLALGRVAFPAVRLHDGRVLVSGGWGQRTGGGAVREVELFSDGRTGTGCGVSSECLSGHCVDGVCCDSACAGACEACSVAAGAAADGACVPLTGAPCEDGDRCTAGDTCQAGACVSGGPVTCAPDACHDAGVCDPATGACTRPSRPDGALCDDGDACTQRDSCRTGICVGEDPIECPPAGVCRESDCDPLSGMCSERDAPEGASCDDGDACSQGDVCRAGECIGEPKSCPPRDACHLEGSCDPEIGACSTPPAPDGTACFGGVCTDGACRAAGVGAGAGGAPPGAGAGGVIEEPDAFDASDKTALHGRTGCYCRTGLAGGPQRGAPAIAAAAAVLMAIARCRRRARCR